MATYTSGPYDPLVQITASDTMKVELFLPDAADATLGKTGIAFDAAGMVVAYCKPGETSFTAFPTFDTNNWAELGYGWYQLIFRGNDAGELALLNTVGPLKLRVFCTASKAWNGCRTIISARRAQLADTMDLVDAPNADAVTAIQAGLALESGGQLDTIAGDVAGLDGAVMRGTDSAALAATALSNLTWTNAKAAFLDGSVLGVAALVWNRLTAALTETGSIGAWILDKLDRRVSTVGGTIVLSAESNQITVSASGEGVGSTGAISLTRGANVTIAFTATGKALTGHSLYCTVRPTREDLDDDDDSTALFSKACTVTGATTFSLALTPTETDLLTLGTIYYYEIRDVTAADPLIISHIVVKGSVVKRTS